MLRNKLHYSLYCLILSPLCLPSIFLFFFFFNDTPTTEIYTLSLHDALPILDARIRVRGHARREVSAGARLQRGESSHRHPPDRKSTRLNSSHQIISYAVFCLKKKKKAKQRVIPKKLIVATCICKCQIVAHNS